MTITHTRPAVTREDRVQALAARWSKTGLERVQIARDMAPEIRGYALEGGTHVTAWLKGLGWSHGSAINLIGAARALDAGLTSDSVSELADLGHLLKRGKKVGEVQALQKQRAARKALTEAAGIGLGSVRYPTESTEEMVGIVLRLVDGYRRSGLTVPELPELTLAAFRLADQARGYLTTMEGAAPKADPESEPKPALEHPTFYDWLARQGCCVPQCGMTEGIHLHHILVPGLPDSPGGRRHKHNKHLELILPLCPRHHANARHAAHQMKQRDWDLMVWKIEGGSVIRASQFFAEWAEENHLLRGGTP